MGTRHIGLATLATAILSAMLLAVHPAMAQTSALTERSARAEALTASGIIVEADGSQLMARAIFVKLRPGTSAANAPATVRTLASQAGIQVASTSHIPFAVQPPLSKPSARIQAASPEQRQRIKDAEDDLGRIVELHYVSAIHPRTAATLLMRSTQVEYAEAIQIPQVLAPAGGIPNDPLFNQQGHFAVIGAAEAWDIWPGDTNTVIGIVDIGIDNQHQDLAPNIKENAGETGVDEHGQDKRTNGIDDDQNGVVDDWRGANLTAEDDGAPPGMTQALPHGTRVSGLAAAATNNGIGVAGVANLCKFFPIKAARAGSQSLTRGYEGLIYAARNGCNVINLSWGREEYSQTLQNIITDLVTMYDVAIVAAAGNTQIYQTQYPAGYRHVLGVAGVDNDGALFTSWGEQVDISSPTGYTTNDNNDYYDASLPYSSFAAPVVSGALALVRSRYTTLNADQSIAHLRLSTNNVDLVNPGKEKLMGYGRLNVYRAITTDPFSHPAIVIDSLWLTDLTGNGKDGFKVGEKGLLHLRVTNILGDANNLQLKVATYTDDSLKVAFDTTSVAINVLKGGDTTTPKVATQFQVLQRSDTRIKLRFDITADGGYNDYQHERVLIYQPYTIASTSNITLSLTDHGRIGYADYPANSVGTGLAYKGTSFTYEGGFVVASDSTHLLSNLRNDDASGQQDDFTMLEAPSPNNDSTLVLDDSNVEPARRIGLQLRMRAIAVDSIPDAIGIQLRTRNISSTTLDSLRVAMFIDWDLLGVDIGNRLDYVMPSVGTVPFYGLQTSLDDYWVAHGVVAPAPLPIFYAIQNDVAPINLYDGFDQAKKWLTVSNGVGATSAGPADVSLMIGRSITHLAAQAEDTTLWVIGIATTSQNAVEAMMRLAAKSGTSSVVNNGPDEQATLGQSTPNPFNHITRLDVRTGIDRAELRVYDILGRKVADLSNQLSGQLSSTTVIFDASQLPNGVYYIQLVDRSGVIATQRVVHCP